MSLITRKDVERSFSAVVLARGRQYFDQGKVLDAWLDEEETLHAEVDGSNGQVYEVEILLVNEGRYTYLSTDCTCPYGSQCKHAAAAALFAQEYRVRAVLDEEDEEGETTLFALPKANPVSAEITMPSDLREWLNLVKGTQADVHALAPLANQRIFYRLQEKTFNTGIVVITVTPLTRNILKSGKTGAEAEVKVASIQTGQRPKNWTAFDHGILTDLYANAARIDWNRAEFRLDGRHGDRLLRELLASGQCIWANGASVQSGENRKGHFQWETVGMKGVSQPTISLEGRGKVFSTGTPWYVDFNTLECGPLECELPPTLAGALIRRGPIQPEHLSMVRRELEEIGVAPNLLPSENFKVSVRAPMPTPCLAIDFEPCPIKVQYWSTTAITAPVAFGKLTFEYEGVRAPADGSDVRVVGGDEFTVLRRNPEAERLAKQALLQWGWREANYSGWEIPKGRGTSLCIVPPDSVRLMDPMQKVEEFNQTVVPILREAGWRVDIEANFRFVPDTEVEWDISLDSPSGIDWFQFKLGMRVEGEPFDLRSILAQVFKEDMLGGKASNAKSDDLFVFGLNGRAIRLSRRRLTAILQPLVEIFGGVPEWPDEFQLPKSAMPEVAKLQESAAAENVIWRTTAELERLDQSFKSFDRLEPMAEPEGFTGQLRGYQREGLAWLQFLREFGFGGVLADDMGLGKTVQILAHIQTEKAAGRMDRPCLIVAPTSTMPNWRRECERFAPGLKVITLQGGKRAGRFAELEKADVALTTYPLLARDKAHLVKADYHLLVLDEAQNIKNPITAAAKAARELNARHRICLSGTPVENHLGELWALFHFLMPGFLGIDADFRKRFRNPIEKSGDATARERLARRIRPFMLRRTKGQVVQELPPKTEIIETIEFDDPQRDLYESLRVAMDEQVRNLIASQGFDKSRIQVLDALLKLRQVCCDPRLVKIPSAQAVKDSAKLDRLIEMLGILLQDGRRVLLFSQFTSMLDLIEVRLREERINWVRISGDSTDRETPVQRFQAGEVPLFLISLKAGGTGLNLTAADTVILYDPWWNPAVENQAIDRAHRIGQVNPVIVYKMVAAGTIEEKMLEMQVRKGDIARSILTDDAEGIKPLTAEDLRWMLSRD